MTERELWNYFEKKKVAYARPLDRDLLWILKRDFDAVGDHFKKEFNILHAGDSFRSRGHLRHVHAVEQGEYVFLHKDTGNLARFFPLGIVHLFLDVVPYIAFALVKGVPMKTIFECPQQGA